MLTRKRLLFLFIPIFISQLLAAQTPEKALENVKNNYAQEGIFIHFDKQSYVAGETIWFKAYLISGMFPSDLSSAINVELLNDSGKVVNKKVLPIIGSSAIGEFDLPKNSPQINYTVRAYTRRMLNFGSEYFYERQLMVYNPSLLNGSVLQASEESIYFLPEGGNMIAGIPNAIAFKSADKYGNPLNSFGGIVNSAGDTVATFKSVHDGMGKFYFFPQPDEKYMAVCNINGKLIRTELPPISVSGVSFQVQHTGGKVLFTVNKEKLGSDALNPAYILGVMNNSVLFRQDLPADNSYLRGNIPLEQIPSGVLQLTLFNKENQPVAERMVFVNTKDYLIDGNFKTDTFNNASKSKNAFSYDLKDAIPGTFSVSVTDYDKEIASDDKENIISRILLANDIKGRVNNSMYYFESDDEEHKSNLDLVMMTNGWRRFNWDQILSGKLPALSYKDPNYITLKGKAYKDNSTQLLSNTSLSVIITTKDSATDFMMIPVDKDGSFEMPGMIFKDTAVLKFQKNTAKDKAVFLNVESLQLSKLFSYIPRSLVGYVKPVNNIAATDRVKEVYNLSIQQLNKNAMLLSNVELAKVRAKSKTKAVQDRYAKDKFSGFANTTLDFITNPITTNAYTNIFEYLKGRVSSVTVTGGAGNYNVNYRSAMSLTGGMLSSTIFLDGAEVNSMTASTIRVSEIALVQIYGPGLLGGPAGAVAIFTKQGDDRTFSSSTSLNSVKLEGFSPVKEFFSPDYDNDPSNTTNDKRTTLYWDPHLITGEKDTKIHFSFFNTDNTKRMKVVLTGVTMNGKLLYVEKIIE